MQCLTYIRSSVAFGPLCSIFIHCRQVWTCKHFFACRVVCWDRKLRCSRVDKYQKCEEISLFKLASRRWSSELNARRPAAGCTPTPTPAIGSSGWSRRSVSLNVSSPSAETGGSVPSLSGELHNHLTNDCLKEPSEFS